MRTSFKKAIALFLTMTTMAGCMAIGAHATATYETLRKAVGNVGTSNTAYMHGSMRYHYDTNNINILTKVEAYSEFVGVGSYNITSGNQQVYLHNKVTVKYSAESGTITRNSYGERFYPGGTIRYTDYGLYNDPLVLDDDYRTEYAISDHWLRTSSTSDVWHVSNVWE